MPNGTMSPFAQIFSAPAFEKAKALYRDRHGGAGCRMFSDGAECDCFLCAVDRELSAIDRGPCTAETGELDVSKWVSDEWPKHLRDRLELVYLLRRWANRTRGYYGVPVYLCGSALRDDNPDARDWDVRMELPDDDFAARYGYGHTQNDIAAWIAQGASGDWGRVRWRWSDDCLKHGRDGWLHTHLAIDFQVYPLSHAQQQYAGKKRLQLDTRDIVA